MASYYWQPFNKPDDEKAVCMKEGYEVYLVDTLGNKYADMNSGLWNVNFGYRNEKIIGAMKDQLDVLIYSDPIGYSNVLAEELAEKLCKLHFEEMKRTVFTCSGSESVELAIKLARKYSRLRGDDRYHIGVFDGSYHGNYYGSMSASTCQMAERGDYGPLLDGFLSIGSPFTRTRKKDENYEMVMKEMYRKLRSTLMTNKNRLCAILVEPVMAAAGVLIPTKEFMGIIQEFCNENDILLICDEVAAGFGRTGKLFAYQWFDLKPDIVTMSKGINNGYLPLGAVCVKEKIVNLFKVKGDMLYHLSTQNSNSLCMISSLATIEHYTEDLLVLVSQMSEALISMLERLYEIEIVYDIRALGLMMAVDIANTAGPVEEKIVTLIQKSMFEKGFIVGKSFITDVNSSILLFPPFITTEAQLESLVGELYQSIKDVKFN